MFETPKFDDKGIQSITKIDGKNANMLMDIDVVVLDMGQSFFVPKSALERAVLLLEGRVCFEFDKKSLNAERQNCFDCLPYCVHADKDTKIKVTAETRSQLLIQKTVNDKSFKAVFYKPEDCRKFVSCQGKWEDTALRDVITVFDYENAPYSNMVLGEVVARQGRWWGYIPHRHPQPEVYYFKFDKPDGFGCCFIGDDAFKIVEGSAASIPGGLTHPQVTAPGYRMYCAWMIRHLDDDPWKGTRIDDERYLWLLNE